MDLCGWLPHASHPSSWLLFCYFLLFWYFQAQKLSKLCCIKSYSTWDISVLQRHFYFISIFQEQKVSHIILKWKSNRWLVGKSWWFIFLRIWINKRRKCFLCYIYHRPDQFTELCITAWTTVPGQEMPEITGRGHWKVWTNYSDNHAAFQQEKKKKKSDSSVLKMTNLLITENYQKILTQTPIIKRVMPLQI